MYGLRAWFSKLRWHYNIDEGDYMHSASLRSLFARSASVSSAPKVACAASPLTQLCPLRSGRSCARAQPGARGSVEHFADSASPFDEPAKLHGARCQPTSPQRAQKGMTNCRATIKDHHLACEWRLAPVESNKLQAEARALWALRRASTPRWEALRLATRETLLA